MIGARTAFDQILRYASANSSAGILMLRTQVNLRHLQAFVSYRHSAVIPAVSLRFGFVKNNMNFLLRSHPIKV